MNKFVFTMPQIGAGRLLWSLVLLLFLAPLACLAEQIPQTVFNPKPAEDDLVLPMPDGGQMVFRRVPVPGKGFWGDQSRIIQVGDAAGGVFEGLQRMQVSGTFVREDGTWEIILGKYEVTVGQFVAVMGMDRLLAVSKDPQIQKLPTLQGRALHETLMLPLSFFSYQDVSDFLHRYNQWLFDPAHPERLDTMPRLVGAPGFLRLPTEDEWEYCARGGLEALQAGTFENNLPFAASEANEYAWHLGNANHKLRPIGLRKPTPGGFYDLHGNVQEMTAGLFRPEIWQGKPGGVTVRGGSVSTPIKDLRSALRAELEIYAWDADAKKVVERRSFNTGVRLAIGSNVVVNSAQRAEIEKEYEAYRAELRRTTPTGRTLDNLVAQASGQIGDTDPIIERLINENPALQEPLAVVQATLATARERLELAQRESARSLAQDALRNGVNLSVYLSRLDRLRESLSTARELSEISSRYEEQVQAVEKSIAELETALGEQLQGYREKIGSLGEYDRFHMDHAFVALEAQTMTRREQAVLELLKAHALDFAEKRRAEPQLWLEGFSQQFARFSDS